MPDTIPFQRIAVLGTGLIGGSFALAVRKSFLGVTVVGFDRPETAAKALARGTITEIAADLASAVRGADLVYVALPIAATMEALPAIAAAAAPNALVTDACSTKAVICRAAQQHFKTGARFLGGHPMAGKEHSGIDYADAGLFADAPYAIIATESEAAADPRIKSFADVISLIGGKPVYTDADTHDWAVGIVSHLPQLLAVALARVVQDERDQDETDQDATGETGMPLSLAGQGLRDTLRLAGSPYNVWRDVLLTNTDNISRALDRLSQAIDYLRTQLSSKEIEQEFRTANDLYKLLRQPKSS
jgi:prephenate dehydrogenase